MENKIDVKARNGVIVFLIILVLLFASLFAATSVYIIKNKKNANTGDNTTTTANGNIIVKEEHFTLELPSNWNGKYEYTKKAIGGADEYEFKTKSDNAWLFSIVEAYTSLDSVPGRSLIKQVGSTYFYFSVPTDTPSESSEYAELAKSVESEIKNSVKITYEDKEYDTAIAEIKKCLKDEDWLVKKGIMNDKASRSSNEKVYFAKLKSDNDKLLFVVRTVFEDSSYLRLVSYDGKEVTVNGHCGADYGSTKIDVNNKVVEVNATMYLAYYRIQNGDFVQIEKAENGEDGSDTARKALTEKYSVNNFVEINTELTSQNVDTYVK